MKKAKTPNKEEGIIRLQNLLVEIKKEYLSADFKNWFSNAIDNDNISEQDKVKNLEEILNPIEQYIIDSLKGTDLYIDEYKIVQFKLNIALYIQNETVKKFIQFGYEKLYAIEKLPIKEKLINLIELKRQIEKKWIINNNSKFRKMQEELLNFIEDEKKYVNELIQALSIVLPTEPTNTTPKKFKYFRKEKGKYYVEPNCNFKQIAYCLYEISNNAGEGIITIVKNSKIFNFQDSKYISMKTYIKTKDFGKYDKSNTKDLMQELKQILKEAKII